MPITMMDWEPATTTLEETLRSQTNAKLWCFDRPSGHPRGTVRVYIAETSAGPRHDECDLIDVLQEQTRLNLLRLITTEEK